MEELIQLRESIEKHDFVAALQIVDQLEEMSVEDKLNKIFSYMVVLLLHLIKEDAEKRLTKSWKLSINNSIKQINRINKRRKSGGYYANKADLNEIIDDAFELALEGAAIEAFGGAYDEQELLELIKVDEIKDKAISVLDYLK
jgi:DNA integrity scanning protein DisA with diadenylate cyclase activity